MAHQLTQIIQEDKDGEDDLEGDLLLCSGRVRRYLCIGSGVRLEIRGDNLPVHARNQDRAYHASWCRRRQS